VGYALTMTPNGTILDEWSIYGDHVTGAQLKARRDPRLTGRTAADLPACFQQLRPGGAVDRAVNPAAAQQPLVGGIHDRIDGQGGDVTLNHDHSV